MKALIKAGILIDCTGDKIQKNKYIIIEDDKISDIVSDIDDIDIYNYKLYDFSNYTVMPGMINCHVHIDVQSDKSDEYHFHLNDVERISNCLNNLKQYLDSGVTHIRCLGCGDYLDVRLKDAINRGVIKGPKMLTSGPLITMTGGHGYAIAIEADGVDECKKAARNVIKNGSDVVKLMATGGILTPNVEPGCAQLSYEEMKSAVDEAHRACKKTAAHAQGSKGIKNAVLAGIDSIEHGVFLDKEIIEEMKKNGTFLVPTLAALYFMKTCDNKNILPEYAIRKIEKIGNAHIESFRLAYNSGVKIAMGTDAGTQYNGHNMSWMELKLMTENGMSKMDALLSATKNAAELLSIDKLYGTIEIGKIADIIAVNGNPLDNIEVLSDIKAVFVNGEEYLLNKCK